MNYMMDPESEIVDICKELYNIHNFQKQPTRGPQFGRANPASARADQGGGGPLKRKQHIQSDSKSRKAKLTRPVTPDAQNAVANICMYIYMHMYRYMCTFRDVYIYKYMYICT